MNPYDVLGVPKTASEAQIKTAYRKTAKKTHPDASGGNGDAFALASKAYALLMDKEARTHFDATGSIDELAPLTVRHRMIQMIAEMFNDALRSEGQKGTSLKHFDLMTAMRFSMEKLKSAIFENHQGLKKSVTDRTLLLKRITRQDDGENLFANLIRRQLAELESILKRSELDQKAIAMACDELLHYKSEVELVQAIQMMQFGGNFSSTNVTGNFIWGLAGDLRRYRDGL